MKTWSLIALFGIVALLGFWFYSHRDRNEWLDTIPARFVGDWSVIPDWFDKPTGITKLGLSSSTLTVTRVDLDRVQSLTEYPVRRVSRVSSRDMHSGELVIFYGDPYEAHIAMHRLYITYDMTDKIWVGEIIATGYGEDHVFMTGEFIRSP